MERVQKILNLSTVVVLKRKGYKSVVDSPKMITVDNPYFDVSSTEIKEKIKNKKNVSDLITEETERFIKEKNIY